MRYVLKFRTTSNTDDSLAHHGIKGQKWGRRRFQNEDGSLTDAGKKRYADDDSSYDSKTGDTKTERANAARAKYKQTNDEINNKVRQIADDSKAEAEAAVARFKKEGRYDPDGVLRDQEALNELRSIHGKRDEKLHAMKGEREKALNKMQDELDEIDPAILGRKSSDKTENSKPETGVVPVNQKTPVKSESHDGNNSSKEKAYDPDEITDAPKKSTDPKTDSKKKPDVELGEDDYVDKSKDSKTNGKTKTEKEAEEAHKRAEERAKEAEKNRKEEEQEKKENAKEREREAQRNLMEEAAEDRQRRREADLRNTSDIAKSAGKLSNDLGNAYDSMYKVKIPRMNLEHMSNKEMQDRIQREALERQYDQMFNTDRQRAQAGKERVTNTLKALGTVLTVGGAAIDLAMKIKKARGD